MKKPANLITWASIAIAVITVIITLVFFVWWMLKEQVQFGGEKFDQVKWMQYAQTIQSDCKRGEMAHDLQSRILVKGVQKQAVMALLGAPSFENTDKDGKTSIEYDLGKCMHVYHALLIYFDANGHLMHSRISSH